MTHLLTGVRATIQKLVTGNRLKKVLGIDTLKRVKPQLDDAVEERDNSQARVDRHARQVVESEEAFKKSAEWETVDQSGSRSVRGDTPSGRHSDRLG